MAETIESFVAKIQSEGVEAGQKEAEKLREQARQEAERIVQEGRDKAQEIVDAAKREAEQTRQRGRTELELAARDVVLRLRETLVEAVRAVLAAGARQKLDDASFLGEILHELILEYARCDVEGTDSLKISVKPELRDKLADWALGEVGQKKSEHLGVSIDLKGTLDKAGFEYTLDGATVDVTVDSVAEVLTALVSPKLREVVDKAIGHKTDASGAAGGEEKTSGENKPSSEGEGSGTGDASEPNKSEGAD